MRRIPVGLLRTWFVMACCAGSGCAPALMKLPGEPGVPAPDFATTYLEATRACKPVSSMTAEIGVTGSVSGQRLRARILAGFKAPSARLEAVAPFGGPLFVFVATGKDATLLLPRDDRVVEHADAAEVLEAIAGVRLGPSDLLQALTGCASPVNWGNPQAIGDQWRTAAGTGGSKIYLKRDTTSGPWRVVAILFPGPGLQPDWRAEYSQFRNDLPGAVRLVASDRQRFDLSLTLTQVEVNTQLAPDVFRVDVPASARPMSIDELRNARPGAGKD
ncbi:MAG TPA: hypothetical protein VH497_20805 [Vicinamibacterales bacterium]